MTKETFPADRVRSLTLAARQKRAAHAMVVCLATSLARAQDLAPVPPWRPQPLVVALPPVGEEPPGSRWWLHVGQSSVFDTNIDQVQPARPDQGVVFTGGAGWRDRLSRPSVEFSYEAALHQYRQSPMWDRVSHHAEAAFEKRLSKRWSTETKGEMSLKGTSEDRELGNLYTLKQRVDFRFVRGLGLRLYGAGRLKRYPQPDRDRNATNAYAGTALRLRLGPTRLDLGSRHDTNDALSQRQDFARWVHEAQLTAAFGPRDDLGLEVRLYDQRYLYRTVRVGSKRELRHDHRLTSSMSWNHRLGEALGVELAYTYEGRSSNDPDKEFGAHLITIAFDYRLDRGRWVTDASSDRPRPVAPNPIRYARDQEDAIPERKPLAKAGAKPLAFASADEWDERGISLLSRGSYLAAVDLYRQAILKYPSLKARIRNLTGVYSQNGQHELAYCLDPNDSALRRAWEQNADKQDGLCPETR